MPVKIIQRSKRNHNVIKVELALGPTWAYEIWIQNRRQVVTGFDSADLAEESPGRGEEGQTTQARWH